MKKQFTLLVFIALVGSANAQRIIDAPFGKGLYNVMAADSSWSMKFGLRFQSLYVGESILNDTLGITDNSSAFLIRRARLKFDGFAFSPKVKYKIELGLSNRDLGKANTRNNWAPNMILDAVIKWNFYENFELWGGQTKLPGNRERVVSSANMQFVDRSMLNSMFNIDRDMGVQLRHSIKLGSNFYIKEAFAVSQGEGRNVVQDNLGGFQYTGRVEFLPLGKFQSKGDYVMGAIKREDKVKLAIGATYDFNHNAVKTRSNLGDYMTYTHLDTNTNVETSGYFQSNIKTLFIDMMMKYKGISFMAEYAKRDADNIIPEVIIGNDTLVSQNIVGAGTGLNLCLGYMFNNNWEVSGRYTSTTPAAIVGGSMKQQYTLGISKYIVGHALKVQGDVSYLDVEGTADKTLMYRLQFDLHF